MQKILFKSDYISSIGNGNKYGKVIYQIKNLPDNDIWRFKIFSVKPGFYLSYILNRPGETAEVFFETCHSPVEFSYCLAGKNNIRIWGLKNKGVYEFQSRPGINVVSSLSNTHGNMNYSFNGSTLGVGLLVDPQLLLSYLDSELNKIPKSLKAFLEGRRMRFIQPSEMTPAIHMAASQIINSPYTGNVGKLFLESKAIELLALQIEALTSHAGANQRRKLQKKDIDAIYAARDILINNMQAPPSLVSLARLAGTNEFKLKIGFKQVFNMTAFGFLRDHKMKQACKMMEKGGMNVSEVAWEIGYSNVSHFIKAYRHKFGVNPGVFLKKIRHGGQAARGR